MKTKIFLSYLGVLEGPHIELKVTKYSGSKTSSQSRQMYNKGEKTSYSYMGPNVILLGILGYSAGGGGERGGGGGLAAPSIIRLSPSCLPAILLPMPIYL